MMCGQIVFWFPRLGYGFIRPEGASPRDKDIYFHATKVKGGDPSIYKHAAVEFDIAPNDGKRPSAINVRVLNAAPRTEAEQTTSAPVPKPATMQTTSAPAPTPQPKAAAPLPARKPVDANELPPKVARALGLLDEPEQHRTKRDRLNSADHGVR